MNRIYDINENKLRTLKNTSLIYDFFVNLIIFYNEIIFIILLYFSQQARSLIIDTKSNNNKISSVCEGNVKTDLCKLMLGGIIENTRQLFIPPILRYTLISVTINLTFHIGYILIIKYRRFN